MAIYSKSGDKGKTSLYKGRRVYKDNLGIEALGSIDEVNSYLGLIKACNKFKEVKNIIEGIQKDLISISAEIFAGSKTRKGIRREQIEKLEKLIFDSGKKINLKKDFYLPGQNPTSASLDIARVVARKAERRVISLYRKKLLENPNILIYLNRLSDLLFLLARSSEVR